MTGMLHSHNVQTFPYTGTSLSPDFLNPKAFIGPGEREFFEISPPGVVVYRLFTDEPRPQIEVVEPSPNRIVEILNLGYDGFEQTHPLQTHIRQAVRMAMQCRTSALGGHVERCPDGHVERVWYNSCGHRFCPRCAYRKQQTWLVRQRQKLLPVRHFHATFTIPHAFNDLWWQNPKQMANILFHSAAQALQELLGDPERVGVEVGIIAALHTWDDRLLRHPHLHCLVTGGGLTSTGEWKDSYTPGEKPFLVSVTALMRRFRRLFCRRLTRQIKKDQLKLPQGYRMQQTLNIINKVNRTNWEVYIAKSMEDGGPTTEDILEYQAKAVAGGPISEMRIVGIEHKVNEWVGGIVAGQEPQLRYVSEAPLTSSRVQGVSQQEVTFRWGTYDKATERRERDQSETLLIEEFIRRLLWHVPPPNLQTVRHYGLYTSAKQADCQQCRAILPKTPVPEAERAGRSGKTKKGEDDGHVPLDKYMEQRKYCPECGKKLVVTRVIPSSVTAKISPRDKPRARALRQARRRGG